MTSEVAGPSAPVNTGSSATGMRIAVVACGLVWIGVLGWLIWTDSNPVVLNRTQILAAPLVVQGTWVAEKPPRVKVSRVWKGNLNRDDVTIVGPLPVLIPRGEVLIPLTPADRAGATFEITHGELLNPTSNADDGARAQVQPLVYPFDSATQAQLEQLLPAK